MRKEIVLAIILGVLLGGVIIFGINLANKSSINNSPNPSPAQILPEQKLGEATLQVTSLENNSVSFEDTITLTGKTLASAWVALIWEDGETIIQSDESGNWQQEISLIGGKNTIEITASDGVQYQESQLLTIIYTTAIIPTPTTQEIASPSAASASGEADQVNENLKQRIQEIVKDKTKTTTLKGYAGVITKINDINLVINISPDKTLQVTTNDSTDIIRNGKAIKVTSLSIDEEIIIIGQLDTEDILSAKRIVAIDTVVPDFKRQIIIAPINSKVPNLAIGEFNVDIPKKSNIDPEELQDGQTVMAIIETDLEDNTNTLLLLQPLLQLQ